MGRLKEYALDKTYELMERDGHPLDDENMFELYWLHVCNSKNPDEEPINVDVE